MIPVRLEQLCSEIHLSQSATHFLFLANSYDLVGSAGLGLGRVGQHHAGCWK